MQAHNPKQAAAVVANVQQEIEGHCAADQLMLDKISAAAELLTSPTGFEGFEPIQRRRLTRLGGELDEAMHWFAEQRNLDLTDSHVIEYADLGGSISKTSKIAGSAIQSATKALGRGVDRIRGDRVKETTPE